MPADWSVTDRRFLRSLRIEAGAYPEALPRFLVEPGKETGEYNVRDRLNRCGVHVFTPESFEDPKASAEDFAKQLNEKHQ